MEFTSGRDPGSSLFPGQTFQSLNTGLDPSVHQSHHRKRQGHSSGKHHLPFQQPQRVKRPALLLNPAPFGSLDLHQFTVSWASPQDWECQPGRAGNTRGTLQLGGTSCVTWAQPLGTAWCWHTESSPLLPSALDKLLLSPGALPDLPVESSRALAEYRLVLKALQRKGEYNKHSLTVFGNRKNYFQSLCL